MDRLKKLIRHTLTLISMLCLILLLVSAFSYKVSPLTNSYIPFLGLSFPFILGINLLFFIFWLMVKKWKQVILFLLVFTVCLGSIRTYFPINFSKKEMRKEHIKVLTYNVMRFDQVKKHTDQKTNPIIQYVIEQDPDIICFQEFVVSKTNAKFLLQKDLSKALSKTPYFRLVQLASPYSSQLFGIAVFSKYPILSMKELPLESRHNGAAMFELDVNGKRVTLIVTHLESNKLTAHDKSEYYDLTTEPSSQKLEAFTHTVYQRLAPAYKLRAQQAEIIHEAIQKTKNDYVIVCGDFNDTPISYTRYKIKGDLVDAFTESGSGMGITFNRNRFLFRIDYILHSQNMKAYNCTVGDLKNSDHYPVSTYLEFLE